MDKKTLFSPNTNDVFKADVVRVKRFGNIDKIIYSYVSRLPGFVEKNKVCKGSKFVSKLDNNLVRAKNTVFELAICNEWTFFCTLTIDERLFDRYNLSAYKTALSKWLNNYKRTGASVKYLLIPELHKDCAIHMHGLLSGVPDSHLCINQFGHLDWPAYHNKFGFVSLSAIKDSVATAKYITKYISKDVGKAVSQCGAHLYYASKGLKRADTIFLSKNTELLVYPDFENEYVKIISIDNTKEDFHEYISCSDSDIIIDF